MFENLRFEKITDRTDIAYALITSIIQDSLGFIWFGTDQGLARYDGINFKIFTHDVNNKDSIIGDRITCLYENHCGNILIGASGSGLIEYNIKTDKFVNYNLESKNRGIDIMSIQEDGYGCTWLGTLQDGVYKLDRNKNVSMHFSNENVNSLNYLNSNAVKSIYLDSVSNKLFIGTLDAGLSIYDFETGRFLFHTTEEGTDSKYDNRINIIYRDKKKSLWVGTENGLKLYDESKGTFINMFNNPKFKNSNYGKSVRSICEDDQGFLWIASIKDGLLCLDGEKNIFKQFIYNQEVKSGLWFNSFTALYKDNSNVIWIGTNVGGAGKLDREQKKFYNIVNNSPEYGSEINYVTSIYEDSAKNLWIGTHSNGLFKCSKNFDGSYVFKEIDETKGKFIRNILCDSCNNIWVVSNISILCCINAKD